MSGFDTRSKTVEQLVEMAGGPNVFIRNQAQAEMTRRLIEALNASGASSEKYSKRILFLTWLLVGLTVLLVMTPIWPALLIVIKQW